MEKYVVSVLDFGVVGNTESFQDEGIQKAIDEVFLAGGGEVQIPGGRYRVRGMRLRSNVTLHLLENAVLEGSRDINDYFYLKKDTVEPVDPAWIDETGWEFDTSAESFFGKYCGRWHNGLIRAYRAENIAILGEPGSIIDGRNCFDEKGEEYYRGAHCLSILECEHIVLRGYTIQNSANWAHNITECCNVLVENVTCLAGHDGVHCTSCEDVIIRRCQFYTGDDCVAGFANKNVLVEDCEINTACSAFRFGGTDVLIHHCHIFAPAKHLFRGSLTKEEKMSGINAEEIAGSHHRYNMLSLFTYYADFTVTIRHPVENIVIRDCVVEGADRFLHFNYSGNENWQHNKPLLDITFENITATGISMPLTAYGDPNDPIKLTMKNVDFSFRDGFDKTTFMHLANVKTVTLKNVNIRNCRADHLIKSWSKVGKGTFVFDHLTVDVPEEDLVFYTTEDFICQPI